MSTRIKGVALILSIGEPAVDYKCDISKYLVTNEEGKGKDSVTTFCDAASGGARNWLLKLTAVQSTDTASLWRYIWENSGKKVKYVVAAHGNDVPTADQPHLTGTLTIGPKPDLGGEAGTDKTFTFETEWELDGEPTLLTAPAAG